MNMLIYENNQIGRFRLFKWRGKYALEYPRFLIVYHDTAQEALDLLTLILEDMAWER